MSLTLNLHITGLCAIVPDGKDLLVLLVNARDYDHMGKKLPRQKIEDQHIPMLCVAKDDLSVGKASFEIPPQSHLGGMLLAAFPLDGDDLSVSPVKRKGVSLSATPKVPCPQAGKARRDDFGWIANMTDVGAPKIGSKARNISSSTAVLARLRLTAGVCKTEILASNPRGKDLEIIPWTYKSMDGSRTMPNSPSRALADVVRVEVPVDHSSQVRFRRTAARGGDIVLASKTPYVTAYLINVPLTTLLGNDLPQRSAEIHFAHFYRLAPGKKKSHWIPWPELQKPCETAPAGTIRVPNCPPTLFGG